MASHTRHPDVLRELFAVLGNDPLVIAECLARPILAERLIGERKGGSSPEAIWGLDGKTNRQAINGSWPSAPGNIAREAVDPPQNDPGSVGILKENAAYTLEKISAPLDCDDDTWTPTTSVNAPTARTTRTAVWTGNEMIIWGGANFYWWPEYRRQIQSNYRQLDGHQHDQRTHRARQSVVSVDWERVDYLGRL